MFCFPPLVFDSDLEYIFVCPVAMKAVFILQPNPLAMPALFVHLPSKQPKAIKNKPRGQRKNNQRRKCKPNRYNNRDTQQHGMCNGRAGFPCCDGSKGEHLRLAARNQDRKPSTGPPNHLHGMPKAKPRATPEAELGEIGKSRGRDRHKPRTSKMRAKPNSNRTKQ